VDAGIVYATDAAASSRVAVAAKAPPGSHRPIVYPLAVVRATAHPREARALAEFLRGPEARGVLRRRGFLPPPAP
jgi:molybdate transport system substrate-binding protein